MAFLALMGFLLLKHAVVVHVMDLGYSYSRTRARPRWYLGLFLHNCLEGAVTFMLLAVWAWPFALGWLLIEQGALVLACCMERKASYDRLIRMHFLGELVTLSAYAVVAMVHWQ